MNFVIQIFLNNGTSHYVAVWGDLKMKPTETLNEYMERLKSHVEHQIDAGIYAEFEVEYGLLRLKTENIIGFFIGQTLAPKE